MKLLSLAAAAAWAGAVVAIAVGGRNEPAPIDVHLAFASMQAMQSADIERAETLSHAALSRNPRNTRALAVELQAAVVSNAPDRALSAIERILRIEPTRWANLKPLAVELVEQDLARETFKVILKRDPDWARDVMVTLNDTSKNYALVADLDRLAPLHQKHFINRVARERGLSAAYLVWLEYAEQAGVRPKAWPFNADFRGLAAPEPFNWSIDASWV